MTFADITNDIKDGGLQETYNEADKQNWTKLELEDYERASIKERDEQGRIEFAEKKAEKKSKIEVARNLKTSGVDIEIISKSTGLTKDEIDQL
jgi:predicted transposase/invertase (TIGR01784 family)